MAIYKYQIESSSAQNIDEDRNLILLYKYAKIFKIENILSSYMEVL